MSALPQSFFRFVRSVLPADINQLLFLTAVVCLFIAPHLRWVPRAFGSSDISVGPPWSVYALVAPHLITLSGAAGYFICFWPGSHPLRRIFLWVCVPAVFGYSFMYGVVFHVASRIDPRLGFTPFSFWKLGVGAQFTTIGLILVVLFASRLALGVSSLPLTLPESSTSPADDSKSWVRSQAVVWVQVAMIGPLGIATSLLLAGLGYVLTYVRFLAYLLKWVVAVLPLIADVVTSIVSVVIAAWIMGEEGRQAVRRALRLPVPESFAIAIAIPIGITAIISLARHLVERAIWTAHQCGQPGPPHVLDHLSYSDARLFVLLLFAALNEELVFRGILQPGFVRRYGLIRGIFLVSTAWAAAHYSVDFLSFSSYGLVLFQLVWRLLSFVSMGFVLSWLTLRTRSVLPAAVAHATSNAFLASNWERMVTWGSVKIVLWAAFAVLLFRYWPVRNDDAGQSVRE